MKSFKNTSCEPNDEFKLDIKGGLKKDQKRCCFIFDNAKEAETTLNIITQLCDEEGALKVERREKFIFFMHKNDKGNITQESLENLVSDFISDNSKRIRELRTTEYFSRIAQEQEQEEKKPVKNQVFHLEQFAGHQKNAKAKVNGKGSTRRRSKSSP